MSVERNKEAIRLIVEQAFNNGNLAILDEVVAEDYIEHLVAPGAASTRDGFKQLVRTVRSAFSDVHITAEEVIGEGDKVAARVRVRGPHQGDFGGIPPTGKRFEISMMEIFRFEGGMAVERWGEIDTLGLMRQLGVIQA